MKLRLLLFLFCCLPFLMNGQIYLEQFDDGVDDNTYAGTGLTTSEADGEWTITGDGTSGAYELFGYTLTDDNGDPLSIDMTATNKIYVRAKASNLGTQLRMDVKDADGFVTTLPGVSSSLVNDYVVYEYDYTDNYFDGGYGGTACDMGNCAVDGTKIVELQFFINPGQPGFGGRVEIDYLAVGTDPGSGPMSDVWQLDFDGDSTNNFIGDIAGYTSTIDNSIWTIKGDGTNDMWAALNLLIHNEATNEQVDVDVSGNDKVFIRMKSTIDGTAFRLDLQDINSMATTAGSVTQVMTTEWETYEFNFAGSYSDLAYGGTGCEEGGDPCPVDATRIANLIFFVNPGVPSFAGEVHIEYISVGTALEANPGGDLVLAYGDHFSEDATYVNTPGAFTLSVENSNLKITGDGSDPAYTAISYSLHDDNGNIIQDVTGNDKLFIRVKSSEANTLLRMDLIDTAGYITTQPSFTKLLTQDEYTTLEINFRGNYLDAGYGGTSCEEGSTDPCPVDGSAISTLLLYPNPADGGFMGDIEIDYISFGAPMSEDIPSYNDHFDNDDRQFISDGGGFTITEAGTEMMIVGDGSAGTYTAFSYSLHDSESGEAVLANITSNNKIYLKAKSTVDNVPLRIDVVDEEGYASTEPATLRNVGTEYSVIEFDFTGTYMDGGYGGTPCDDMTKPCPVDGTKIKSLLIYVDPNNGGYDGTLTIDWLSTIKPLETIQDTTGGGPLGIDNYADDFDDDKNDFVADNDGLISVETANWLTITGDSTSGAYAPIVYTLHEGDQSILVNAEANSNKLFVRAKSTKADLPLRIDLQDNEGYLTSLAGLTRPVTTDFTILEYDFNGQLNDGGYGGTPCTQATAPCPVDSKRVDALQIYMDPGVGLFNGELVIDWVSFGQPLVVDVVDLKKVESVKLFPNPVEQEVYLQMESVISGDLSVVLYDLSGKQMKAMNLGAVRAGQVSEAISMNGLPKGLYLMEVQIDQLPVAVSKLVKK